MVYTICNETRNRMRIRTAAGHISENEEEVLRVTLFARELETQISSEEVERRHLTPELKRKLRTRILIECAADVFLPMPVQVAYHVYQLLTLKELF